MNQSIYGFVLRSLKVREYSDGTFRARMIRLMS